MGPDMGTVEFQLKSGVVDVIQSCKRTAAISDAGDQRQDRESGRTMKGSWSWVKVPDLDGLLPDAGDRGICASCQFESTVTSHNRSPMLARSWELSGGSVAK